MWKLLLGSMLGFLCISCTAKKQEPVPAKKQPVAVVDTAMLNRQIAGRESRYNQIKDTASNAALAFLLQQQIADSRSAANWTVFCKASSDLYNLCYTMGGDTMASDSVHLLDDVIALEDTLKRKAAWRELLAGAFGQRYYIQYLNNRYDKIIYDCEKFFAYCTPEQDTAFAYGVLTDAGNAAAKIGDHQLAVFYLKKLLDRISFNKNPAGFAKASVNLANAYNRANEPVKAIQAANLALTARNMDVVRKAKLYAVLADAYNRQGIYPEARRYVLSAQPLLEKLPDSVKNFFDLFTVNNIYGDVLFNSGQLSEALAAYKKSLVYAALNDSSLNGREVGKTYTTIGLLFMQQQQTDSALAYYDLALQAVFDHRQGVSLYHLPAGTALWPENAIMDALDLAAEAFAKKYETQKDTALLQQALRCFDRAFEVEAALRRAHIYDDSKYRWGDDNRHRSEQAIKICMLLQQKDAGGGWGEKAFFFAEKSKASVLLDKTRENLFYNLQKDTGFISARQAWLFIQRLKEDLQRLPNDTRNAATRAALESELAEQQTRFAANKTRVNRLTQEIYDSTHTEALTTPQIREKLLNRYDGVLEYFTGDSLLYRFLFTAQAPYVEIHTVPLQLADSLLQDLLPFLTEKEKYNQHPAEYNALASRICALLFPANAGEKLIIIPDGLLQFLPFEALQRPGNKNFLLEKYQFNYAFSCTSLLEQMAISDDHFANDGAVFAPFVQREWRNLPLLPQSGREVKALQGIGKNIFIAENEKATAGRFMQMADSAGVLHIATHAFAEPSDSVPPRIEFADSTISLDKLYALQLRSKLVVLSACQTGIGKLVNAEGALSLARGFYYAGARNVINSLWKVDDQSAGQIFETFYRVLEKEKHTGAALAIAQREYLEKAASEKRSPYYWAGFVCVGDGAVSVPGRKNYTWIWIVALAGVLVLCVRHLKLKRKAKTAKNGEMLETPGGNWLG